MKGTRPLDNDEIRRVSACFTGNPFEVRNRSLFMIGVSTGGRISELLSLRIEDVYQNNKPVSDLALHETDSQRRRDQPLCPRKCGRQESHRRTGELAPGALPNHHGISQIWDRREC